jgi:hypothetical protein
MKSTPTTSAATRTTAASSWAPSSMTGSPTHFDPSTPAQLEAMNDSDALDFPNGLSGDGSTGRGRP